MRAALPWQFPCGDQMRDFLATHSRQAPYLQSSEISLGGGKGRRDHVAHFSIGGATSHQQRVCPKVIAGTNSHPVSG